MPNKPLRALSNKPLSALEYWELRDKSHLNSRIFPKDPVKKSFLNCMEFAEDYADYICKFEKYSSRFEK